MIRRKSSHRLSRQTYREEEVNPMEGTGNLADVMLVLAVGMMLAVIMNWNVDISTPDTVKELNDAETLSEDQVQEVEANDALEEKGVVYQDPDTGKFYIRVEE